MSISLNKELMLDNIYYRLQELDMKIGELEAEADVSPGYISRTSKDENSRPGIDFVIKAAHALQVSVDTLLNVRLSELTPTEKYLFKFLEKLKRYTSEDKLAWNRESASTLNQIGVDDHGNVEHILFSLETFFEEGESEYPDKITRVVMNSHTFGFNTYIEGDCFDLEMKNRASLYLMNISKNAYNLHEPEVKAKEIWIHIPRGEPKFICGTAKNSPFSNIVEDLYSIVAEFSKHPKIPEDLRFVIDAFMEKDDLSNDEYSAFDL